jgi:ribose/xylose/arabinose/galactoside ABC-type transport system permease subunit
MGTVSPSFIELGTSPHGHVVFDARLIEVHSPDRARGGESQTGRTLGQLLIDRVFLSEYFVIYLSLLYLLVVALFFPIMVSVPNLQNILTNVWPFFVVVVGQTLVFIVGQIDLSQTSIMCVTSVIGTAFISRQLGAEQLGESVMWGWFITERGGPLAGSIAAIPVAIAVMLLIGALIGLLNGTLVTRFRMPAFMVTLGTQLLFYSFALYLTRTNNILNLPEGFVAIGREGVWIVPYSMLIAAAIGVAIHLLLARTRQGVWFYATGANPRAARVSGVPAAKVIVRAYVISGLCAATASVIYSARIAMGRPTLGSQMLMDIVGATIIGGTSMFGGKGKVVWSLFGVFFFVIITNSLNIFNLSYFTVNIVKGSIILLAAIVDVTRTRLVRSAVHG